METEPTHIQEEAENEPVLIDEFGKKYRNVNKTREIPRKTFLFGRLHGKYWGELDEVKEQAFKYSKFYDFNIYEVEVKDAQYNKETPFEISFDATFPRERLPALLPIVLKNNGKEYSINIHEPQVGNVIFNHKLHQDEGKEVFGTIDADITGYLLDFIKESYVESIYIIENNPSQKNELIENKDEVIINSIEHPANRSSNINFKHFPSSHTRNKLTGKIERSGNYIRTEHYTPDFNNTYWGNWIYNKPIGATQQEGCLSSGIGTIGTAIGLIYLILLLPHLVFILPFILLPILFNLIPVKAWSWIFKIVGCLMLVAFVVSIISSFNTSTNTIIPKPVVKEKLDEGSQKIPIVDNVNDKKFKDTLITHFRTWKDYNNHVYSGSFWIKASAFNNAKKFKANLSISENTEHSYDKIVYMLKENDKQNLNGLYQLFDSIKNKNNSDLKSFAEIIVSFVQDIPYTVVLPEACDPNLYSDNFIRNYLSTVGAVCDGNERFGINTPVEFMATLKGDCDTRTLLLYTLLSHYGYDVIMLSSEFYNHSLIGINLPYDGPAFQYNNINYILWETTALGIKPGAIPNEISNLNYWRISLKSK